MSSLNRLLAVLDTFGDGNLVLTADQICARTGYAVATGYRYIRQLCEAGLLVRLPHGYAPGPRIIEWDYMVRSHDPLLAQSREVIAGLVADTGLELLLSQLYGDRVVNVHYEHSAANPVLQFGRGRVMPLFRGSTSRVILAHMPTRQLRRLFEANAAQPEVQRIGVDWEHFRKALSGVRKQGWAMSTGEVLDGSKVGIAAPVFGERGAILGSLTLIGSVSRLQMFREDYIAQRVVEGTREITQRLSA